VARTDERISRIRRILEADKELDAILLRSPNTAPAMEVLGNPLATPEPSALAMFGGLGTGACTIGARRMRRKSVDICTFDVCVWFRLKTVDKKEMQIETSQDGTPSGA
jgi:hypothetical protein